MMAFTDSQKSLLFIIPLSVFSTPQNYKKIQYEKTGADLIPVSIFTHGQMSVEE